jgi:hypothetical protein
MSGIYENPANYVFDLTIRGLTTVLTNEPSDLLFPTGDDFNIVLQLNVSEAGIYYGDIVTGVLQAEFSVSNSTFSYPITISEISAPSGRYNLTIAAQYFPEGDYTITAIVNPSSSTYQGSQLIITFFVRPARSDLTANLYTISTPYNTDANVTLTYTDLDRSQGITIGTVTSNGTIAFVHLGSGIYEVAIDVSGFSLGSQAINLTADAAGFDARSVIITVIVTQIHTDAEPSLISLDMPVGFTQIFFITYTDLDNSLEISGASVANNWTGSVALDIAWSGSENAYRVNFTTTGTDALGTYIVWFNFTNGANYQPGYCEIEVEVRTHITIFNLVSAVEPTAFNGLVNISVRYYDWDSKAGIDSANIDDFVWNGTDWISTTLINEGGGFYTIRIDASQFGLGLQSFDVYFNWTGPVQQYENKTLVASVNIIGVDSELALIVSSEPTPYLGNMTYTILYSEVSSGLGIKNTTNPYGDGNVHIYVLFSDGSVDTSLVDIWEVDYISNEGEYTIQFNTTIFGYTGLIYMSVYINWTDGIQPFYTNRLDTISVRVLPRDTSIAVVPATPTAWGEEVSFSFTYEDVTGALSEPIANDTSLSIALNVSGYLISYDGPQKLFTITFNTSEFASLGQKALSLNVTWAGAPFYANQTARIIYVTVTYRQTVLDYQSPPPTSYLDNATFSIIWTDIAGTTYGINGATVTLYIGASPINPSYYSVTAVGLGEYEVELATTYFAEPGIYTITANLSRGLFYIADVSADRSFNVRQRTTLLSAEPLDTVPFNSEIELTLYYQDILTLANIGNVSGDVSIEILNGSSWTFTSLWVGASGYYTVSVDTFNQAGLEVGQTYALEMRFNYTHQSPFYRYDDLTVYFEIRYRASLLEKSTTPVQTPYLDYVNFTVFFSDADASTGIDGANINLLDGGSPLSVGTDYLYTGLGSGLYAISVDSTVLGGLGITPITVWANWTAGSPYHNNATFTLDLVVIERATDVVFVVSPTQTRYLENVSFVVSFRDLALGTLVSATKNLVNVYNGGTQLLAAEFTFNEIGTTKTYEISINSTILTAILASDLNITVQIDWPNSPNYYQDDVTSTRATIRARDTFLSIERPPNTAFGENATFTFTFLDTTNTPEQAISNAANLILVTNLTENPSLSYSSGIFTISFNTSQFGSAGQFGFHINATWNGSPFYTNQTLQSVVISVILRQTQVDFQAPAPTPYGDSVTFIIWYLDIAGATDTGIVDGTLTMYYSGNAILPPNATITNLGDGSYEVVLDTDFFSEPGTYSLNASFVYSGSYYAADASAIRPISVRLRTTVLSADPVGAIGYGTTMDITLYFQDQLTLADIANSSTTFLEILNTTNPFTFSVSWNGALGLYELSVDTDGHTELNVGNTYVLHLNMSYLYQDPFYRWDDVYVQFTIRARTATLDIFEGAQPAPYLEYSTFILYYWDVDVGGGISSGATFTIENETHTLAVSDYVVIPGSPGYYTISVNSSSLSTLGVHELRITAVWSGGIPYYTSPQRNITISVTERTTEVEIVSPPSSTQYLDNVTFTFRYTDTVDTVPITGITEGDIDIYSNGTLLNPGDFVMNQLGSLFEVSINSTVLSSQLVQSLNITIIIDWNSAVAPYYEDAITALKVSTIERVLFVEVGTIDITPKGDNITISFTVNDDSTGSPISNAIILFSWQSGSIDGFYTIYSGTGPLRGQYNISLKSDILAPTEADLGDFKFDLEVQWDPATQPYYRNRTAIELTASVDAIWAVLQYTAPQPSSVQITDWVSVNVTYTDFDHGVGIVGIPLVIFDVSYLSAPYTGIIPQNLTIESLGSGKYNITFNTRDINTFGNIVLNITAKEIFYTISQVQPSFIITEIETFLDPSETEILLYWSLDANVSVEFRNYLYGNTTSAGVVGWTWGSETGFFIETYGNGTYYAAIPTTLYNETGTHTILITADAAKYQLSTVPVTLIIIPLPSDMIAIEPEEVFSHPRGNEIPVAAYLNDTINGVLINSSRVTQMYITFNNTDYDMFWNATDNSWYYTLPTGATSVLQPGFIYTGRITARFDVYDPVSFVFKVDLQATVTNLEYYGNTREKMNVTYSDFIIFDLNFTETDGTPISFAQVFWQPAGGATPYYFTNMSGGMWRLNINSTAFQRWGTFGVTFSGVPFDTNLDIAFRSVTVTVKRIETAAISPDPLSVYWGWKGNVSFTYQDTHFNRGIDNKTGTLLAIITFDIPTIIYDLGNGTYSIYIDTTLLDITRYRLLISFVKDNHESSNGGVEIFVQEVPTELILDTPPLNWFEQDPEYLVVPYEESVTITLFYNDTDGSDGYIGGLFGATNITSIFGGALARPMSFDMTDHGDGYYSFVFDTTDLWLFFDENPRALPGEPYSISIELELEFRESKIITLQIEIINRPTEFTITRASTPLDNGILNMTYGDFSEVYFSFVENWTTSSGEEISGAELIVTIRVVTLEISYNGSVESIDGNYIIRFFAPAPFPVNLVTATVEVDIEIIRENYESGFLELLVYINPTPEQNTLSTVITVGFPGLFIILTVGLLWVRIFSIPKRLRQMNSQIKALRKGKIPKPIEEAKSRQQLIADLYNDTNKDLEIVRDASMMPLESIPVEVPEMGEILIQLSILTHLSPDELDEFKADISKMKMSEQAAFVKEVIHQEAIRAARRDGTTIEQVIADVEAEARARLRGEEERAIVSEVETPEERILLLDDEEPDTTRDLVMDDEVVEEKVDIAREIRTEEAPTIAEKLSDYEIEELRKELQEKGVEPHEIETIIEQARELPRDLVDELLKSLDMKD